MDATNFTWTADGFTITELSKNSGLATATGSTYHSSEGLPDPAKKASIDIECVFKLSNNETASASDTLEQGDFLEYVFASASDNGAFANLNGATVISNMFTSASNSNGDPVITVDGATAAITHNGIGVAGTFWKSDSWDVPLPATNNIIKSVFTFTLPYSGLSSSSEVSWASQVTPNSHSYSIARMNFGDASSDESSYNLGLTMTTIGDLDCDKTSIELLINGSSINTYPDHIWDPGGTASNSYSEVLNLINSYAIDTLHEIKIAYNFVIGGVTTPVETKGYFAISKR